MEDYIEILFILIFIISSIASSMKKKKKRTNVKNSRPKQKTTLQPVEAKRQKSSTDILEEMLGLKINLPEPPSKEAPTVYSEDSIKDNSSWDPSEEYETEVAEEEGSSDYEERILKKKNEFLQDREKHRAFKDKVVIPKVKTKVNDTKYNELFSQQQNLKDYIIIQEILNKPKALRR